jgi:hypothetical protein
MKNLLPFILLLIAALGCDLSRFATSDKENSANTARSSPTAAAKQSQTETPKPEQTKPALTSFLKKSEGKYPYEVKLLENAELKTRLKKLLGKEYSDFHEYFDVQSPIKIEQGIFRASGCQAHYCPNIYYIFVDLKADNINVYHQNDGETTHYFEKGEIELPATFAEELEPAP